MYACIASFLENTFLNLFAFRYAALASWYSWLSPTPTYLFHIFPVNSQREGLFTIDSSVRMDFVVTLTTGHQITGMWLGTSHLPKETTIPDFNHIALTGKWPLGTSSGRQTKKMWPDRWAGLSGRELFLIEETSTDTSWSPHKHPLSSSDHSFHHIYYTFPLGLVPKRFPAPDIHSRTNSFPLRALVRNSQQWGLQVHQRRLAMLSEKLNRWALIADLLWGHC